MPSGWANLLAAGFGLGWHVPVLAQRVPELGVQAMVATSSPTLTVGGLYGGVRLSQRVRVAATAGAGVADGDAAARGELLAHFLLNPGRLAGVGLYAGAGLAGVVGPVDDGYLVLLLGLESRPGAGSGWAFEFGVGGGVRIAAGYRWRRHPMVRGRAARKRNRPGPSARGGAKTLVLQNARLTRATLRQNRR